MLGERIDVRRKELGLSQVRLAEKSGLSAQYINNLIRGKRGMRIGRDASRKLAKALRVSQIFFDMASEHADINSTYVGQ